MAIPSGPKKPEKQKLEKSEELKKAEQSQELAVLKGRIEKKDQPDDPEFERLPQHMKVQADQIYDAAFLDIVPGLALAGANRWEIQNITNLKHLTKSFPNYKPSAEAKAVLKFLDQIDQNPEKNNLNKYIHARWEEWVQQSYQSAELAFGKEFATDKISNTTVRFVKRSFKEHPVMTSLAVTAGAYGAYRLVKHFFRRREPSASEAKPGSRWTKILPWGVGLGGLFLAGKHFWPEVKKLLGFGKEIKGAKEKIEKAQKLFAQGKYAEGMILMAEALGLEIEDLTPEKRHIEGAQTINGILSNQISKKGRTLGLVTPEALSVYRKMKWKSIGPLISKINSTEALYRLLNKEDIGYNAAMLKAINKTPRLEKEIQSFGRVAQYLADEDVIEINDEMTVDEIVAVIQKNQNKIPDKKFDTDSSGRQFSEKALGAAERGAEAIGEASSEFLIALKEGLGEVQHPDGRSIAKIVEEYEKMQSGAEDSYENLLNRYELAKNIAEAAIHNKMEVALIGPKVIITKGPGIIFEATWDALSEGFKTLYNERDIGNAGLVYLSEAGPIIVFGAMVGGTAETAKRIANIFSKNPKFQNASVLRGTIQGGIKGAVFPLKALRTATVDLPRNLKNFKEFYGIQAERLALARNAIFAKPAGVISPQLEESYKMRRLFLAQRQFAYASKMEEGLVPLLALERGKYKAQITKYSDEAIDRAKDLRRNTFARDLAINLAEKVDDFKVGNEILKRPKLVEAILKNKDLEAAIFTKAFQQKFVSPDFLDALDEVIKDGKKLTPEALATKVKDFAEGWNEAARKRWMPRIKFRRKTLTPLQERLGETKLNIARTKQLIEVSDKPDEIRVMQDQLKRLAAEQEQVKSLQKVLESNRSAHGKFLRNNPKIAEELGKNTLEAQNRLKQFLKLERGLVKTYESLPTKEAMALLDQLEVVNRAQINEAVKLSQAARNIQEAARKVGQPMHEFLRTDAGKVLQEAFDLQQERVAVQEVIQNALRSKRSPYGKALRADPELLQKVITDETARRQFFSLDKRVLKHINKEPGAFKKLVDSLVAGKKDKFESALKAIGSKLKISNILEAQAARAAKGLSYAVQRVEGFASVPGKMFRGAKESVAKRSAKLAELFKKTPGFKVEIDDLIRLSETGSTNAAKSLLIERGLKLDDIDSKVLGDGLKRLAEVENVAEVEKELKALAEASGQRLTVGPEASRLLKIARFAGTGLSAAGAAFSGYETASSLSEAWTTTNEDRKGILYGKAGMYGTMFVVDTAATYALASGLTTAGFAGAGAAGTVGAFALPLIPITYMGGSAIESMYERTLERVEWRANSRERLVHDWVTTTHLSAGDAYRLFSSTETIAKEKQSTRIKIVEAILLNEEGKKIGEKPNQDRLDYIETISGFKPSRSFEAGMRALADSAIYASLMLERRRAKADKVSEKIIGSIDLMDDRFENPDKATMLEMVNAKKTESNELVSENQSARFDQMSTGSLLDLYYQVMINAEQKEGGIDAEQNQFLINLKNYLEQNRKANMLFEMHKRKDKLTIMPSSKVLEWIEQIEDGESIEAELSKVDDTPSHHAVYKLAEFFGFSGHQNETELKEFFNEDKAGIQALYWDGEQWRFNDNYGLDEELGTKINEEMIVQLVREFEIDWKDIFSHRAEALVDYATYGGRDMFEGQSAQIAKVLRNAFGTKIEIYTPEELAAQRKRQKEAEKFIADEKSGANLFRGPKF